MSARTRPAGPGRSAAMRAAATVLAAGVAGCQLLPGAAGQRPGIKVTTPAAAPAALAVILDPAAARARADFAAAVAATARPRERLIVIDEVTGRLLGSFTAPGGGETTGPAMPPPLPRDPTAFERATRRTAVARADAIVRRDRAALLRRERAAVGAWAAQSADAALAAARREHGGTAGRGGVAAAVAGAVGDLATLQQGGVPLGTRRVLAIIGLAGPGAPPRMHASLAGLTVVVADGPGEQDQAAWQAMLTADGASSAFVITPAADDLTSGILGTSLDGRPAIVVTLGRIWYGSGQFRLPPAARAVLARLRWLLAVAYPGATASINAYTDSRPVPGGNLALSWQRARLVLRWLVGHGIASSRLQAAGHGAADPVAPNHPWGQPRNRRVVVIITPAATAE